MQSTIDKKPLLWNFNTIFSLLMTLPGIGLITASFLVNQETQTGDGHPLNLFLLILGAFFLLTNGTVFAFHFISNKSKIELMQHGHAGTAIILDIKETGTRINGMPRLKFLLEVNDGFNPVREVQHCEVVPLLKIAALKKDMQVQIKVHPRKTDKILVLL